MPAYKNYEFNGYQISISGSVYQRRADGSLRRVKGREAQTQIRLFMEDHKRKQATKKVETK